MFIDCLSFWPEST